jgi:hypothetical protein
MFQWLTSDPDTMWLNITNAGLGLCVVICVAVAVIGISKDLMAKARERVRDRSVFVYDPHSMMMPDLGLTMADGGEPVVPEKPKSNGQPGTKRG